MIDQALLSAIRQNATQQSWQARCLDKLSETNFSGVTLVNKEGISTPDLTNVAWGITIGTCYKHCNGNSDQVPYNFNFQAFAAAMTNYFLPWLTLTAQLPFETGTPWSNVMSFCLALGSPSLITFSLTITILNRLWIRQEFADLKKRAEDLQQQPFALRERIRVAQLLLEEAQQVPLRASQESGWLSSLLLIPANTTWWHNLTLRIRSTRRGFTASLVAQMALAFVAYLFTVIASFLASLGDPNTALQIASGSIWIWLIPVILGWITVGTQITSHSIEDALSAEPATRALATPIPEGQSCYDQPGKQHALIIQGGLNPQPEHTQTAPGTFEAPKPASRRAIPSWLGAPVGGDEEIKGPIHNYARVFTFWQLATTLKTAFECILDNIETKKHCSSVANASTPTTWNTEKPHENVVADAWHTAEYCGLNRHPVKAYGTWSVMGSAVYRHIFAACLAALVVQWGTTGSSILIAYTTPTAGLGCRSGSYLLYGCLGTVAWICLFAAMLLSHEVMLRYQHEHSKNSSVDFRRDPSSSSKYEENHYERDWPHAILCGAAVSLRYTGKTLCVINTIWLIGSSLMEFIGGYDNCWCMGNSLGMGSHGWLVLFKDAAELATSATLPWSGGLVLTLSVCCLSYVFFALGSINAGAYL